MSDYTPSAENAPNGPRNNKDELEAIDANTAEFAKSREQRAVEKDAERVEDVSFDPFGAEFAPAFTLITLMRIYDVGMALLKDKDEDAFKILFDMHAQGRLLGASPWIDPDYQD